MQELVVVSQGVAAGHVHPIAGDHAVIGRDGGCEIVVPDPHISRRHAALTLDRGVVYVEDLASRAGTRVNGLPVQARQQLRAGDLLQLAGVVLRYDDGTGGAGPQTRQFAPVRDRPTPDVAFHVRDQHARQIDNIGGNKYVQLVQQRDSFLRETAATRTKARLLVWLGLVLTIVGAAGWAGNIFRFIEEMQSLGPTSSPDIDLLGPEVGGIPIAVIAFFVSSLGSVLVVVGIVLHVVATARRRRVERDFAHLL